MFLQLIKKYNIDLWHFNFLNFKSLILINILKNFNQKNNELHFKKKKLENNWRK